MAEFDLISGGTRYKDLLARFLKNRADETLGSTNSNALGHAAIRAYAAYKNETFLDFATAWWNWGLLFTVSDADVSAKQFAKKNITIPTSCSNRR
ncbi:hypothetical protein V5O48_008476 [Marasmius crinis-equi]|uniref:Uncharacterized protein n=1 Tax=Marasmius crinis-equi TaxID=585013 RepID=A0ABR3FDT4_9AGAR